MYVALGFLRRLLGIKPKPYFVPWNVHYGLPLFYDRETGELEDTFKRASRLEMAGKLEEALVLYGYLNEPYPGDEMMNSKIAWCHKELGQYDQALEAYERIRISPEGPERIDVLELSIGEVYFMKGDLHLALEHLGKTLKITPKFSYALELKGRALIELNRLDEAAACFQALLDMWDENPTGIEGLAKIKAKREMAKS